MAYKGFKVSAAEVTKDDLAFINHKLARYGQVPKTVVKGWNDQLNTWQNELLGGNTTANELTWNDAKVSASTQKAIAEYEAFRASKPGKHDRT